MMEQRSVLRLIKKSLWMFCSNEHHVQAKNELLAAPAKLEKSISCPEFIHPFLY
jgi:hypothetical protein